MQGVHLRKYGVEFTIDFELYEVDGVDLRTDWVPAQADCEIMKDGGASTMCTNTATDEGSTYSIVITATEAQAARLILKIVDAATKVFLDKIIVVETYGNASAQHIGDLDDIATTTELAKVPKSDSTISWNATALAAIQDECKDAVHSITGAIIVTVGSGSTTTNVVISAIDSGGAYGGAINNSDMFLDGIVIGNGANRIGIVRRLLTWTFSGGNSFTVSALPGAPISGDTFLIIPATFDVDTTAGAVDTVTDVTNAVTANTTQWGGENVAAQDTSGYPVVTIKDGAGQGEINTNAGQVVNVGAVNGSVNSVVGAVGSVAGNVDGTINGFTAPAKAEIQAETSAALVAINLDHYMKVPVSDDEDMSTEVAIGTVLSLVLTAAGDVSGYVPPDDSLQAIRDRGDAAWITGAGGSTSASVISDRVWDETVRTLTANTNLENLEVDMTRVAGSALAETSDGNIAANFGTFYDNGNALTIKTVDDVGGGAASVPPSIR